jgi:hypothetical protein
MSWLLLEIREEVFLNSGLELRMRLFVSSTGTSHEYIEVIVVSNRRLHFSGLGGTLTYLFLLFHLLSKLCLYQFHLLGSILCAGSDTECHHIIIMLSP